MALIDQINDDIKDSMRNKNLLRLDTLRMLKSKILAVDARSNLPDAEVIKLFKNYLGSLEESLSHAQTANRADLVTKLEQEMVIVREFLPRALTLEEIRKIVTQAIAESGAKTKKDLGMVMKGIMKINSSVDGKIAKELADQLLP